MIHIFEWAWPPILPILEPESLNAEASQKNSVVDSCLEFVIRFAICVGLLWTEKLAHSHLIAVFLILYILNWSTYFRVDRVSSARKWPRAAQKILIKISCMALVSSIIPDSDIPWHLTQCKTPSPFSNMDSLRKF